MTPGLRHRSLSALRKVLTSQQQALFAPAGGNSSGGTAVACLPEVASAAWRLAVLSSDLADSDLAVS
jgi:hypothetical protein